MGHLQAAGNWHGEFVPFAGWSEPAEIEEAAAVQGGVGNPHDTSQAEQNLFIDFVSAHQIGVVTKIPQEPPEFPKCLRCAIESPCEGTSLMLSWFNNSESQNVKRTLRMPTVECPIDANQKYAFQGAITCALFFMQTRDMAFHGATSCCLV